MRTSLYGGDDVAPLAREFFGQNLKTCYSQETVYSWCLINGSCYHDIFKVKSFQRLKNPNDKKS